MTLAQASECHERLTRARMALKAFHLEPHEPASDYVVEALTEFAAVLLVLVDARLEET